MSDTTSFLAKHDVVMEVRFDLVNLNDNSLVHAHNFVNIPRYGRMQYTLYWTGKGEESRTAEVFQYTGLVASALD